MVLKSILDEDLVGKRVLLRVDINSPVVKGKIIDNPRIKQASETIKFLSIRGAKTVIIAHQGRKGDDDFVSLKQHSKLLSKHSGIKVKYIDYLFEDKIVKKLIKLKPGKIIILKNVREYNDEKEVKDVNNKFIKFSELFDIYVNDAFSVSHRKQGSIIIPPKHIKSFMGPNLYKELSYLDKFKLKNSNNVFLIGGSKIEDYLPIFNNLKNKKNKVIASGVLANLLLVIKGVDLGYDNTYLKEKGFMNLAPMLGTIYKKYKNQIILPVDFAILKDKKRKEYSLNAFPMDNKIWDVGHKSVALFKKHLKKSKAVFMKGPLGYSELEDFSYATVQILKEISSLSKTKKILSLLGGGHLTTSIDRYKIQNNFSYISLSGGALIAYISGEKLPGLVALESNKPY